MSGMTSDIEAGDQAIESTDDLDTPEQTAENEDGYSSDAVFDSEQDVTYDQDEPVAHR